MCGFSRTISSSRRAYRFSMALAIPSFAADADPIDTPNRTISDRRDERAVTIRRVFTKPLQRVRFNITFSAITDATSLRLKSVHWHRESPVQRVVKSTVTGVHDDRLAPRTLILARWPPSGLRQKQSYARGAPRLRQCRGPSLTRAVSRTRSLRFLGTRFASVSALLLRDSNRSSLEMVKPSTVGSTLSWSDTTPMKPGYFSIHRSTIRAFANVATDELFRRHQRQS
jgi:hypothetical protein